MKKHAYLIIAHNNFYILEKALKLIDDPRNDIYIHIDKKVKNFDFDKYKELVKKSKIIFIKRKSITWGDFSQIRCEVDLLKAAINNSDNQKYSYYHLLSGVDLPIKTQDYIHEFMDENSGLEFVHYAGKEEENNVKQRINIYYLISFHNSTRNKKIKYIGQKMKNLCDKIQKKININRLKKYDDEIKFGANWFSITDNLARYIVQNEKTINKHYKYSLCADELFLQTLVYNSKFKDNIYIKTMNDEKESNMRYVDWTRGEPYTFKTMDFDELISSKCLFARKFSEEDKEIVDKIFMHLIK